MGRRWAERVTGPKAAHWTRPIWPRREKFSRPPWTPGHGPVHAVGLHGSPTGRVIHEAQRPFTQPLPGKGGLAPPLGARRARRRRSLPSGYGGGGVLGSRWGALASGAASRSMPGSRSTSTARRPGSRRGGAVSTPRRSHTRRRDGFPASDQSSGVCSGPSRRARSSTDKPRLEGLHGMGRSSRARRGVERLRAGPRRRRGRGHGARGCGRPVPACTSTCRRVPSARRPVQHRTRHATESASPDTARRGWCPCAPGSPALSRAPAPAGRRGPALALGCAGSATAVSLMRKP
jgi:hypothetical protein